MTSLALSALVGSVETFVSLKVYVTLSGIAPETELALLVNNVSGWITPRS